jgi:hypothetical protein
VKLVLWVYASEDIALEHICCGRLSQGFKFDRTTADADTNGDCAGSSQSVAGDHDHANSQTISRGTNILLSLAKLTVVIEPLEGDFGILANLDEVAVGITHVAAPFPAVWILQGFGKKDRAFAAPSSVAGADVCDAQIEEAIHSVEVRWCFKQDLWLIGSWATPLLRMIHVLASLM